MSPLSRGESIELGISMPTPPLTLWAADQLEVAKGRQSRLERRGIHASYLGEILGLIEKILEVQATLGRGESAPPSEIVKAQRIREEAVAYWQAAKKIVKVEFGSNSEMQVKFRLGARAGRLIARLTRELDCIVSLMGEHSAQRGALGISDIFRKVGETLIAKLKSAQSRVDAVCRALPAALAEQCFRKGQLYDRTRKLVRIGRLEFAHEPQQAEAFNYVVLRRELRIGSVVRALPARTAGS